MKNKIFLFTQILRGDARAESKALARAASADYFSRLGIGSEEILYADSGKPYFPSGEHFLSVSHTGPFFAAAFAPFPIGLDAEKGDLRPSERVLEKYFDPEEKKEAFARVWTAKEAVSKIGGEGISALRSISVRGDFAFFRGQKYRLERELFGDYLITLAYSIEKDEENGREEISEKR